MPKLTFTVEADEQVVRTISRMLEALWLVAHRPERLGELDDWTMEVTYGRRPDYH